MLWTIFVILTILWLVGFMSGYMMGGFLHILLVSAAVILALDLFQDRKIR